MSGLLLWHAEHLLGYRANFYTFFWRNSAISLKGIEDCFCIDDATVVATGEVF